jgi:cell division protein FtsI (penicillin-binding protein 3)/stage V sporulation protein D (sporulation-specific penicillin-binding protein)
MQPRDRAIWVLLVLACGFTVISFHLIQIQLVEHGRFWRLAVENHLRPETIAPRRGTIFDSDGNVLAETQEVYDVRLDGKLVAHPAADLPRIAAALQLPAETLAEAFRPKDRDQLIAINIDDRTMNALKNLRLGSVIIKPHGQRSYPNSELAAHVLGFVDGDEHGLSGVEKEMDRALTGEPGVRWVELDGKSREIAGYQARETPAVDGDDVTLTIRLSIQHIVEEELDQIVENYHPENAYIIVMDPKTGQIMAMGSRPNFDPNNHRTFVGTSTQEHCVTDTVEPGSIFKIITLSAALNEGLVTLDTPIYCENGSFMYFNRELHDDDERFGTLSVEEVLAKSSNIGFAKIALNYVHEDGLYKYATAFGMGQRTGLFADQGESPGILRPVSKWSALSITRIPMGQEVAATPLQMADAMCAVANGGKLMAPQIIDHVTGAAGEVVRAFQPRVIRQVITPETAQDVIQALHQVTVDGTAKDVHIRGYSSWAGKTGTAQKFVDGAYSHTQHVSSFIGFLPTENPGFVALVMIDSPHTKANQDYGAEVSAPVFADMAPQIAQVLNIPPDLPSTAPALSAATPTSPSL